jgi:DNA-nicking Smr family endonuclease
MYKPFHKLKEIFKNGSSFCCENFFLTSKESSWEEVVKNSKPLKEKNFYWKLNPRQVVWNTEKLWPPEKIEVKIWLTSEYMEGRAKGVSRKIIKDLREGRFSIKNTLNLRGMRVEEAQQAFEDFIKNSIQKGDRCVLIIHGRGLSSKGEPILKNKVREWLEKGPYRKYVIAYASARPCDGGAGATYVLLSTKPLKR